MSENSFSEAFEKAVQFHLSGSSEQAGVLYRQIIDANPRHSDALHHLGLLEFQTGQGQFAEGLIRRSLFFDPENSSAWSNLGEILRSEGRYIDAIDCHLKALDIRPDYGEACNNLGLAYWNLGKTSEAIHWCRRSLEIRPDYPEALNNLGIALQESGQMEEAVACFRQSLALNPDYAGAHNNLGNTLKRMGALGESMECHRKAIGLQPGFAEAHNNLGASLREAGLPREALAHCRLAVEIQPSYAVAWNNLGNTVRDLRHPEEAVGCYRRAIALQPDLIDVRLNLGIAYRDLERFGDAIEQFKSALALNPSDARAYNLLGLAHHETGELNTAAACLREAIRLRPDFADAHNHLGIVIQATGGLGAAADCYQTAIRLQPDHAGAHNNLGIALQNAGHLTESIECYRRARALDENLAQAGNNLGIALSDTGRLDEAIECYRQALDQQPGFADAHSNLLLILQYSSHGDQDAFLKEAIRWNSLHALPLAASGLPHENDATPSRRLRIGYVSPDFRFHSVAFFIESLLAFHDRSQVEVFCYAEVMKPDPMTDRLRSLADGWRSTVGISDERVARIIQEDAIDILVDLAGHTAGNRLLVFARKPAPIQVTWLGFPNTTGMSSIDFRLTDRHADPPSGTDRGCTERLIRLPGSFLCYRPPENTPPVTPLPEDTNQGITFGSFNAPAKINPALLDLWAKILVEKPGSRLLLKNYALADPPTRQWILDRLAGGGVAAERVELVPKMPSFAEHMDLYRRVHISLDTYPYHGTTTTCESLWMGVPVVTLAGNEHRNRVGASLLTHVGLEQWIATSPDDYVRKAVCFAGDLALVSQLRTTMRERIKASPLMDGPGLARDIEAAFRDMWKAWCSEKGKKQISPS